MRAGWGMSIYSHCFFGDVKEFIYVCVIGETPSYATVCKVW